nr:pentatricopeptide repeat-containing protein At5g50390, chloroplastic-like isoform X1 [Arachis hypogaea]XP_029143885.1 pentatricopeptide repeat-containing protein At5g50390, chloroplastic-like isoform X1 [Arachis hypogaea]
MLSQNTYPLSLSHNPEYPPLSLRVPAPPPPSLLRAAVGIAISSSLSSPPLSSSSSAALNSCLCPRLRSLSRRSANVPLCRRGLFSSPLQTVALRTVARSSSSASSLSVNLYPKPRPRELILLRVHSLSNFILLQSFLPLRVSGAALFLIFSSFASCFHLLLLLLVPMEIPLSRYQSYTLDQFQSECYFSALGSSGSSYFSGKGFVFGCGLRSKVRNWRNHFSLICCCSTESGIRRPKSSRIPYHEKVEPVLEDTQMRKPSFVGLCSEIEKLVLCNRYRDAIELFEILELEGGGRYVGASTYDALVSACVGLRYIRGVKKVFNLMISSGFELDLYMMNRVLFMHVRCGLMHDAWKLFDDMPERDEVSWTMMIGGLVDSGNNNEAFRLFLCMWEEFNDGSPHTFVTMIKAAAGLGLIQVGRQIHSCALKMEVGDDTFVSCALIDMYNKCGSIDDAYCVFDQMPKKTTVAWNSIISGYALHGYSEEALNLFYEMHNSGAKLDHFTISTVIRICTRLASFEHAKQAHAALVRHGFGTDLVANSALIDFYSKWGRMEDAQHVFDTMHQKNIISWNALIAGYGNHGQGEEALEIFEQMLRERMVPNHVTFLAVLSACSYSGLSERGWEIFQSMSKDHKIKPRPMHYACMIELLGREGLLDEALALIRTAPFQPTANMWAALLTACRMHENFVLGKLAAEKLYGMEPEKMCNYVVLLNIYNTTGRLKEAAGVLQTLKRKGLRMLHACTWIEVKRWQNVFLSGDKSHPQTEEIYQKVDNLMEEISRYGYTVEDDEALLPDVDEEEQRVLKYHSEKLAIAFGLINTPNWMPLQIMQGHRICRDCHTAIKLIAMVTGREIVGISLLLGCLYLPYLYLGEISEMGQLKYSQDCRIFTLS